MCSKNNFTLYTFLVYQCKIKSIVLTISSQILCCNLILLQNRFYGDSFLLFHLHFIIYIFIILCKLNFFFYIAYFKNSKNFTFLFKNTRAKPTTVVIAEIITKYSRLFSLLPSIKIDKTTITKGCMQ